MDCTRRDFFKLGSAGVVAVIGSAKMSFGSSGADVLEGLSASTFRSLTGTEFLLSTDSGSCAARLIDIRDFAKATKRSECFSLHFESEAEQLPQSTYDVFHPEIGNFQLMMTAAKSGKTTTLVATINRL